MFATSMHPIESTASVVEPVSRSTVKACVPIVIPPKISDVVLTEPFFQRLSFLERKMSILSILRILRILLYFSVDEKYTNRKKSSRKWFKGAFFVIFYHTKPLPKKMNVNRKVNFQEMK